MELQRDSLIRQILITTRDQFFSVKYIYLFIDILHSCQRYLNNRITILLINFVNSNNIILNHQYILVKHWFIEIFELIQINFFLINFNSFETVKRISYEVLIDTILKTNDSTRHVQRISGVLWVVHRVTSQILFVVPLRTQKTLFFELITKIIANETSHLMMSSFYFIHYLFLTSVVEHV